MELDSHSTKSPSCSTGTSALGFRASSAGSFSTCWTRRSTSAQVHSTLRTLIEEIRPSTFGLMELVFQAFDALDPAIDDGDHHGRRAAAAFIGPGLDDGLAHLFPPAGVDIGRPHVFGATFAPAGLTALVDQV